jgi:hypothetical protein
VGGVVLCVRPPWAGCAHSRLGCPDHTRPRRRDSRLAADIASPRPRAAQCACSCACGFIFIIHFLHNRPRQIKSSRCARSRLAVHIHSSDRHHRHRRFAYAPHYAFAAPRRVSSGLCVCGCAHSMESDHCTGPDNRPIRGILVRRRSTASASPPPTQGASALTHAPRAAPQP